MNTNIKKVTRIGVLSAAAAILFLIPGIPIFPPIYKLDFSTLPALLGGFAMGPVAGVVITFIKAAVGCITSDSQGVGELADFLVSSSLVVTASLIYRRNRTLKGALIGMVVGIVLMTIVGALANYYVLIPFYQNVMGFPVEAIVGMMKAIIPAINSLWDMILLATVPFNLIKGIVLCGITALLYKRLSRLLNG